MLRNTPLLELVFDEPDSVAWEDAGRLVKVIEQQVHETYARLARPTGVPQWDESAYLKSRMRARIAAPIERGSVIIPLTFELLPIHLHVFEVAQAKPNVLAYLKDAIGLLADAAGLLDFTLGVLYGRSGVLADNRGGRQPPQGGELSHAEADVVGQLLLQRAEVAMMLMREAKKTGCDYVAVRWNDADISIRNSSGGAITADPAPVTVAPPRTRQMRRASDTIAEVRLHGSVRQAILGRSDWDDRLYVLIWPASSPLPRPGVDLFSVVGWFAQARDVKVRNGVPAGWDRADGVFVVGKSTIFN